MPLKNCETDALNRRASDGLNGGDLFNRRIVKTASSSESTPLVELDFWVNLEYRLCGEFAGMKTQRLRRYWCDGFIPNDYLLDDAKPRIEGRAWICDGDRQEEWEFSLVLNGRVATRDKIDWVSLLPPVNVTRWLSFDEVGRRIVMEPAAAVLDHAEQDAKNLVQ